jgi:hypothetical protein
MLQRPYFAACAIAAVSAVALASCGKKPNDPAAAAPGDSLQAAAPTAPVGVAAGAAAPLVRHSDGSQELDVNKYAEQLKHDPTLYTKQTEICHNAGPHSQPPELEGPCAAWDIARAYLDHERVDREYAVTNKDSL